MLGRHMEISLKKLINTLSQKLNDLMSQSQYVHNEFGSLRQQVEKNEMVFKQEDFLGELKRIQDNYDFFLHQMEKNLHLQRYQLAALNDLGNAPKVARQSELITQQVKWLKELQKEKLALYGLLYDQEIKVFRQKSAIRAVREVKSDEFDSHLQQLQRRELDLKEEIEKIGTIHWDRLVP